VTGLFFVGLAMHLWEEGRFPGGLVEMITEHLHFTAISRTFGGIVTAALALLIVFVPLFFPDVPFLAMAAMMAGPLEAIVVLLLPISLYTFTYVIRQNLMHPASWVFAFLYMAFGLVGAEQIVIRVSGVVDNLANHLGRVGLSEWEA
jgi:hypothetical protein